MAHKVELTDDAVEDIDSIYQYIADHDSIDAAERVATALQDRINSLSELPERGNIPKEVAHGVTDYRELHYKPYRIVYRIMGRRVIVYCVTDGRRDMQALLQQRLMR